MMKKLVFIAALAFAFASCEKDWSCDCNYDDPGITGSDNTTQSFEYKSMTKSNAEDRCEDQEDEFQENLDGGARCTLKKQ